MSAIARHEALAEFRLAYERKNKTWNTAAEAQFSEWWNSGTAARAEAAAMSAALSPEEYRQARIMSNLRVANALRTEGGHVRQQMMKGEITGTQALTLSAVDTLRVYKFLLAIPKLGEARMITMLRQVPISPIRKIGSMTDRERARLTELLDGR